MDPLAEGWRFPRARRLLSRSSSRYHRLGDGFGAFSRWLAGERWVKQPEALYLAGPLGQAEQREQGDDQVRWAQLQPPSRQGHAWPGFGAAGSRAA